jgi:hypothetical protein
VSDRGREKIRANLLGSRCAASYLQCSRAWRCADVSLAVASLPNRVVLKIAVSSLSTTTAKILTCEDGSHGPRSTATQHVAGDLLPSRGIAAIFSCTARVFDRRGRCLDRTAFNGLISLFGNPAPLIVILDGI